MKRYECDLCGYVYDEKRVSLKRRRRHKFEDLPDDYECPLCGASKDNFPAGGLILREHRTKQPQPWSAAVFDGLPHLYIMGLMTRRHWLTGMPHWHIRWLTGGFLLSSSRCSLC